MAEKQAVFNVNVEIYPRLFSGAAANLALGNTRYPHYSPEAQTALEAGIKSTVELGKTYQKIAGTLFNGSEIYIRPVTSGKMAGGLRILSKSQVNQYDHIADIPEEQVANFFARLSNPTQRELDLIKNQKESAQIREERSRQGKSMQEGMHQAQAAKRDILIKIG